MTPREIIDTMKIAIAEVEWNYPLDYAIAFEEAIKALEKHIPKKPIKAKEHIRYSIRYICPACRKTFSGTGIASYCYRCGQALDWSDAE